MAARRQTLLDAVLTCNRENVVKLAHDHDDKKNAFNLDEVLSELTTVQFTELWDGLHNWTSTCLDGLIAEAKEGNDEIVSEKCGVLGSVVTMAFASINSLHLNSASESDICPGLLRFSESMNSQLLSMDELLCLDQLTCRVCQLGELWCQRQLQGSQQLAANVIVHLIQLMVTPGARVTKSLSKRVCALRGFLGPCLVSGGALYHRVLLQLPRCPALLQHDEGLRVLAELLQMPQLRAAVHAAVKQALPAVSNQMAKRYGQCYYTAWRNADAPSNKQALEDECIMDLMFHAVHADHSLSRLWRILFQLLHHFHNQRRHRETTALLHRLYSPIIWRALQAPNEMVLLNATHILFDAFPLENPDDDRETRDEDVLKQCETMSSLLVEPYHRVRIVAAKGVCKVLSQYWDLVPMQSKKKLLQRLTQELAFDASCVEVRLQAVTGIMMVLDNPLSHTYLVSVLPCMANAFHDTELSVRVAMCNLLLNVKSIQNIRYFDIVPVKHMLARLASDEPPVCRRLVQLMANSFFPVTSNDEAILTRCMYLVQQDQFASRQFYLHSTAVVDVNNAVRLMVAIRQALVIHVRRRQQEQRPPDSGSSGRRAGNSASTAEDKENSSAGSMPGKRRLHNPEERSVLSDASQESGSSDDSVSSAVSALRPAESLLDKLSVVTGLLDTVAVLWSSRLGELVEHPQLEQTLQTTWSRAAPMLYNYYKDTQAGPSVMYLCSLMPHSCMASMSSHCISMLRQLTGDAAPSTYKHYVDALVTWGRTDDVIELIGETLRSALDSDQPSYVASQKNQRRSVRGVKFREPERVAASPRLAVRWLLQLFNPGPRRPSLISKFSTQLFDLVGWMALHVRCMCEEGVSRRTAAADDDTALVSELLDCYLTVTVALTTSSASSVSYGSAEQLCSLFTWADTALFDREAVQNRRLCDSVQARLTSALIDSSMVGGLTPDLSSLSCHWMLKQLSRTTDMEVCVNVLFFVEDSMRCGFCKGEDQRASWQQLFHKDSLQMVGAALAKLLELVASCEDGKLSTLLAEVTSLVSSLCTGWRRLGVAESAPPLTDTAVMITELISTEIQRDRLQGDCAVANVELPVLSAAVLTGLLRHDSCCHLLSAALTTALQELPQITDDTAEEQLCQVAGVAIVSVYTLNAWRVQKKMQLPGYCRGVITGTSSMTSSLSADRLSGDEALSVHYSAAKRLLVELQHSCATTQPNCP